MKEITAWLLLGHAWAGFVISTRPRQSREQLGPLYFAAVCTLLMGLGLTVEIRRSPTELASFDPLKSFYPSVLTTLSACLLALKIFAAALLKWPHVARALSWIVAAIGFTALVGYAAHVPQMYYFLPGYTTAMAINTATCLFLLGIVHTPSVKT